MTAATESLPRPAGTPRSWLRHEISPLYLRALRTWLRVPSAVIPPLFIPIFFLVVNTSALRNITQLPVFTTTDYVAFFLPVSVLMSVASAGNGSGMSVVQDITTGYFDKLLLAPISRTSMLVARLMVDGTRASLQAGLVIVVGLLLGADIATGFLGALGVIALAFGFGLAFAGIGLNIALRTGNPEATQSSMMVFFPFVFLAPTFVPLEFLPDWLRTVAQVNPMTYVIQGMRELTTVGWGWLELLWAVVAIGAIALLTLSTAFAALRRRARG